MAMNTQNDLNPISQHSQFTETTMRCGLSSILLFLVSAIWGCATPQHLPMKQAYELEKPVCERIITADVVALDQVYFYNRFGSFNPAGIMYALRRDVVTSGDGQAGEPDILNGDLDDNSDDEGKPIPQKPSTADLTLAGNVKLRSDKRPRPLVLRANEGDCLHVTFTNLLSPIAEGGQEVLNDPELRLTHPEAVFKKGSEGRGLMDGDEPATRHASMHVNGLSLVDSIESQGANVGRNGWKGTDGKCSVNRSDFGKDLCALAAPGETRTYTWYAKKEGTFFFYSMGAPAGGEGDGGQLGLGLFGAVNVQPKGAKWYRSQVTKSDLEKTTAKHTQYGQPVINYEAVDEVSYKDVVADGEPRKVYPVLNMLRHVGTLHVAEKDKEGNLVCKVGTMVNRRDELPWDGKKESDPVCLVPTYQKYASQLKDSGPACHVGEWVKDEHDIVFCDVPVYEIVHSDLNAVIDIDRETDCDQQGEGNACGKPYREFTVIFHDEVTAVQAFKDLDNEDSPLGSLRDGMGINYGASGVGPMVVANRKRIGPARDCVECKLEEFFLTSWVNGDPAMIVGYRRDKEGSLIPECRKNAAGKDQECREHGPEHLTGAVVRPDGTIFKRLIDGTVEKILPNGTRTKALPKEIPETFPYLYKKEAKYPDDPSGVHHSYLGDPIRFRNMHAGPKETHVFHLHAHQWVEDKHDAASHYLDSQTISPGSTFSYEVHYGGSGNRNFAPGDSIFHCHLYPHFAQGMWELWRTHDVFENGGEDRRLLDYEIGEGTPTPAIVPLPRTAMPPMPTNEFRGYPFYMAGEIGHRPPQPPWDLDGKHDPDTLRRHVIAAGTTVDGINAEEPDHIITDAKKGAASIPSRETNGGKPLLYKDGKQLSDYTARRVYRENQDPAFFGLARQLATAKIKVYDEAGTDKEQTAMQFHAGKLVLGMHGKAQGPRDSRWTHTPYNWEAPGYPSCDASGNCDDSTGTRVLFRVSGAGKQEEKSPRLGVPGAPYANPCPKQYVDENGRVRDVHTRSYRAAYIQMDMVVNKAGWHDPQARFPVLEEDVKATLDGTRPTEPLFFRAQSGECVEFSATNLIPSNLNLDDFQVYSPTDVIGQHIHLVKFDVTSSDGSGNGWNYEDGTLAADEVRERIVAYNRHLIETTDTMNAPKLLEPKTHPLFLRGGAMFDPAGKDKRGICPRAPVVRDPGESNEGWIRRWEVWSRNATKEHPWCGAQTTIQRWWADPVLNGKPGDKDVKDRTLRTVFTHDHFGPSSHQHHGFYAALVVEPSNSKWTFLDGRDMGGTDEAGKPAHVNGRHDGGPTAYAANIIVREGGKACLNGETTECSKELDNKGSIDRRRTGREFNLAFADFAIVYTSDLKENEPDGNRLRPVNPPSHNEGGVLNPVIPSRIPLPEGISTKDPGTQLINYRNEPIPLRIGEWREFQSKDKVPSPWSCLPAKSDDGKKSCFIQKEVESQIVPVDAKLNGSWACTAILSPNPTDQPTQKRCVRDAGDMAHVFSSQVHAYQDRKGIWPSQDEASTSDKSKKYTSIFTESLLNSAYNGKLIGRQHGDPATPLLQAYDGDRVQIRLIQGAQEEQHVFTMHGARWLAQPDSNNSGWVNAQHIGISEHFEFNDRMLGLSSLPSGSLGHGIEAIPCKSLDGKPCRTDLLFASSAIDNLWDGQWGLMRIYPAEELNLGHILARLPGNTDQNPFANALGGPELDERLDSETIEPTSIKEKKRFVRDPIEAFCKDPARKDPPQRFSIEAWMAKDLVGERGLVYNKSFGITDPDAILFVKQSNVSAIRSGTRKPEPLILRARAGDCIEVTLTNKLPENMPDDPRNNVNWSKSWSYNMLPPIIEGFNFNQLRSSNRVGLHAGLVDQNVRRDDGAHIGFNHDSTVGPGEPSKTYLWYAGDLTGRKGGIRERPIEFGVIPLTDQADVIKHPAHGAIGALVIEPQCSEFTMEKVKDGDVYTDSDAVATVTWWDPVRETSRDGKLGRTPWCPDRPKEGIRKSIGKGIDTVLTPSSLFTTSAERLSGVHRFKEFVLLYQDALALQQYGQPLANLRNGDDSEDSGQKAFNYRTEPIWARLGASAADGPDVMSEYDWSNVLSSRVPHAGCLLAPCDPETPIFEVDAGEPVRFRVVHPGGHPRQHALAIFGHNWSDSPWAHRSSVMGWNEDSPTRFGTTNGIGPARHLNILTRGGGDCAVPGDYLYRTQEGFMFGGGLWGILRVNKPEDPWIGLHPLNLLKQDDKACKVALPRDDRD